MKELIALLEAATEGLREFDLAIDTLVHNLEWLPYRKGARAKWGYVHGTDKVVRYDEKTTPLYTTSIDAALTLLPKGWVYSIADRAADGGLAIVAPDILGRGISAKAKTVSLALCIAVLRARESL